MPLHPSRFRQLRRVPHLRDGLIVAKVGCTTLRTYPTRAFRAAINDRTHSTTKIKHSSATTTCS